MKLSRFTISLFGGFGFTNAYLNNYQYQRRALLDNILESRGLADFGDRVHYELYEGKLPECDILKPERRDLYEIRKRDLYDLVSRGNLSIENRDASHDETQILRKRNSVPFVMGGLPAVARYPAQTLTTHGLGGCWVVAIVDKTTGVANHIPHGEMGHSLGGSVCQTVTSVQQAARQMPQLLAAYHNNHFQGGP